MHWHIPRLLPGPACQHDPEVRDLVPRSDRLVEDRSTSHPDRPEARAFPEPHVLAGDRVPHVRVVGPRLMHHDLSRGPGDLC